MNFHFWVNYTFNCNERLMLLELKIIELKKKTNDFKSKAEFFHIFIIIIVQNLTIIN